MNIGVIVVVILVTAIVTAVLLIKAGVNVFGKIIGLFGGGKTDNKKGCAMPIIIVVMVCVFLMAMCS